MTIADQLRQLRVVPVIVIDDATATSGLADALVGGGLPCAEITFRTAAAEAAIRRLTAERADVLVGAGTVLTPQQAASARAAGAQFIVSPGFNRAVVDYCLAHDVPVFPGVCTPTEVEMGLGAGLTVLKFFPAEPMGGVPFLKALSAPYTGVEFIPTGGINAANLSAYLQLKNVLACGGSWMAPAEWIKARDFVRIRAETRKAVELLGAPPAVLAR